MRAPTILVIVLFLLAIPSTVLAAEEVTVTDLIERSSDLADTEVLVEGELVGDYGRRADDTVWTQLNGDTYVNEPIAEGGEPSGSNIGVGIRMPTELAPFSHEPGGYHHRGPIVAVTGIWKHHDPGRQGESYLEVEDLSVVDAGRRLDEGPDVISIVLGLVLLAAAGALYLTPRRT